MLDEADLPDMLAATKSSEMSTESSEVEEISTLPPPPLLQESYNNFLASTSAPPQLSDHSGYPAAMQCMIQYEDERKSVRRNTPLGAKVCDQCLGEGMRPMSLQNLSIYGHDERGGDVVQSGDVGVPGVGDVGDDFSYCEKADERGSIEKHQTATTQGFTSRPWNREDVEECQTKDVEMEYQQVTVDKSIVIKFPDLEISEEIVKGFHAHIDSVYFPEPIGGRFCFAELESDADVDKVIAELKTISFGVGKLNAEHKVFKEDEQTFFVPSDFYMNVNDRLMLLKRKHEKQIIREWIVENLMGIRRNFDRVDDESDKENDYGEESDESEESSESEESDESGESGESNEEGKSDKEDDDDKDKNAKSNVGEISHANVEDYSKASSEKKENLNGRRVESEMGIRRNFDRVDDDIRKGNNDEEEGDESDVYSITDESVEEDEGDNDDDVKGNEGDDDKDKNAKSNVGEISHANVEEYSKATSEKKENLNAEKLFIKLHSEVCDAMDPFFP